MITFDTAHIEISLAVATALIRYAPKDATRPIGVGVDKGSLCSTDGHRLVSFTAPPSGYAGRYHGRRWARSYVETLIKVAKAMKAPTVKLELEKQEDGYPPIDRVLPKYALESRDPSDSIGVDPEYLADLAPVAKACDAAGVRLSQASGSLDPIGFHVDGPELSARVVIMPMRK